MPCRDLQEQSLEVMWSLACVELGAVRLGAALLLRMALSLTPAGGQRWGLATQGRV